MSHEQPISEVLDGVPSVYRVPESKRSLEQNMFHFKLPGEDRVRKLPKLQYLAPRVALKVQDMGVQDALVMLLGDYESDVLDKLDDMTQLEGLVKGWAKASGIKLGESVPSSDS